MLTFLKVRSADSFRLKLMILYLLNLFDMIFTLILLGTGRFRELNPIMAYAFGRPSVAVVIKVLIPGLVLLCLYACLCSAKPRQTRVPNWIINGLLMGYSGINLLHVALFAGHLIG